MFYRYFRVFRWICNVFGLNKPSSDGSDKVYRIHLGLKIWSIIVIFFILLQYAVTADGFNFNINENLDHISDFNDVFANVAILIIDLTNSNGLLIDLYTTVNVVFETLKINDVNTTFLAAKLYLCFSLTAVVFVASIFMEIIKNDYPLTLIVNIPTFLTIFHLFSHLYILLCLLKVVRNNLSDKLEPAFIKFSSMERKLVKADILKYLLDFDKGFIENKHGQLFDFQILSKTYDDINICIRLLERYHGLQILLVIWQIFSSSVFGVTLVACKMVEDPSLVVIKCIQPFIWCFMVCYVDDQLHKEVQTIDTIIIKHTIDYRCARQKRNVLQNFQLLVRVERLEFTACNLFRLNYSMLLGTIVNIITYSIILIQLFLAK